MPALIQTLLMIFLLLTLIGLYFNLFHDALLRKIYRYRFILKPEAYRHGMEFDHLNIDIVQWLDENKIPYLVFWAGITRIGFRRKGDAGLFRMMWFEKTCCTLDELVVHVEQS